MKTLFILPAGLIGMIIGLYFGKTCLTEVHPRWVLLIGGMLQILSIFTSSFVTNFCAFLVLFGLVAGMGCGMAYMSPILAA